MRVTPGQFYPGQIFFYTSTASAASDKFHVCLLLPLLMILSDCQKVIIRLFDITLYFHIDITLQSHIGKTMYWHRDQMQLQVFFIFLFSLRETNGAPSEEFEVGSDLIFFANCGQLQGSRYERTLEGLCRGSWPLVVYWR